MVNVKLGSLILQDGDGDCRFTFANPSDVAWDYELQTQLTTSQTRERLDSEFQFVPDEEIRFQDLIGFTQCQERQGQPLSLGFVGNYIPANRNIGPSLNWRVLGGFAVVGVAAHQLWKKISPEQETSYDFEIQPKDFIIYASAEDPETVDDVDDAEEIEEDSVDGPEELPDNDLSVSDIKVSAAVLIAALQACHNNRSEASRWIKEHYDIDISNVSISERVRNAPEGSDLANYQFEEVKPKKISRLLLVRLLRMFAGNRSQVIQWAHDVYGIEITHATIRRHVDSAPEGSDLYYFQELKGKPGPKKGEKYRQYIDDVFEALRACDGDRKAAAEWLQRERGITIPRKQIPTVIEIAHPHHPIKVFEKKAGRWGSKKGIPDEVINEALNKTGGNKAAASRWLQENDHGKISAQGIRDRIQSSSRRSPLDKWRN